ncbi:putative 7-carboxy-7-deazaguanine synthase QueE [Clostridium sp.]|uniref:putative 7-carboxy-7-deazaguanine synthase QueE n=1 Tax=Clostridium sp. TaxID=1506 RepID=UPI00321634BE
MNFKVVEKFVSVNGEGLKSGELSIFIRFAGCNLRCSYCDTMWANKDNVKFTLMNENEIHDYIKDTGVKNVTLTGGEPLLQNNLEALIDILCEDDDIEVEIETNGSISLKEYNKNRHESLSFTMDYKLDSSNMEDKMCLDNFNHLTSNDTVKFVVGSTIDLNKTKTLIDKYELINKCHVYLSPVYNQIDMEEIVEFMKKNKMNKVRLQMQLHKIIWDKDERGV